MKLPCSIQRLRLALVVFTATLPFAASATALVSLPTTYELSSGTAVIRASLAGESASLFDGPSAIQIDLVDVRAVIDHQSGPYGRLESIEFVGADIGVALDDARIPIESLDVFSPTVSSLSGSDLNAFGQFSLQTRATASVGGTLPGGAPFGPLPIASQPSTGSVTGLVLVSGDAALIQVVGVTVASFEPLGLQGPHAPNVELKMDFSFVGRASAPIPEPSAALVFGVGLVVAGSAMRRS